MKPKATNQQKSGCLQKRGRKRREGIDESKNVQTTPRAPTASAVGPPCLTLIQIVGRPGTGSLPSTIALPDHPHWRKENQQIHRRPRLVGGFCFCSYGRYENMHKHTDELDLLKGSANAGAGKFQMKKSE